MNHNQWAELNIREKQGFVCRMDLHVHCIVICYICLFALKISTYNITVSNLSPNVLFFLSKFVLFGVEILKIIPGRVSTEVDAR